MKKDQSGQTVLVKRITPEEEPNLKKHTTEKLTQSDNKQSSPSETSEVLKTSPGKIENYWDSYQEFLVNLP